MTRKQINKLHTILAKIEVLQGEVPSGSAERLQTAKSELLRLLSEVDPY